MAHVRIIINMQVGDQLHSIVSESETFDDCVASAVRALRASRAMRLRDVSRHPDALPTMPPIVGEAT